MRVEDRRTAWNGRAAAALDAQAHALPPAVLSHALRQRWMPRTMRSAVDSYWRAHPIRAEKLARALAAVSGTPDSWRWRNALAAASTANFRLPPLPYRVAKDEGRPGHCVVCGQPVFRFGWHRDLWDAGAPNRRAVWHACCVIAWKFWTAPCDHRKLLSKIQGRRCGLSGRRLLRTAHVDHRVPLFEVWREHHDRPWPELLAFWGAPNLQIVNAAVHVVKSVAEQGRSRLRVDASLAAPAPNPAIGRPDA